MSDPAQKPTSKEISNSMASEMPRGFRALVRQTVKDFNLIRATKYGAGPLLVLFLVDWVQGFDTMIPTLFAPEIRKEFNITITQLVLLQQLFGSLFLFTGPLIGYLSDRFRRTRMVGVGALLSGVFSFFSGFAPNFAIFQFMRSIDSASETFGNIPSNSLTYDYYPVEARAKTVAVKTTAGRLIGFLSGPAAGFLAVALGWRTALKVFAIPVALSGLLILRLKDPVRGYWERVRAGEDEAGAIEEPPPVKWGEALRILLGIKTLRRIFLVLPLTTLASSGFALIWQFFLVEQFHLSPFERTLIGIPGAIIGLFALILGGTLADSLVKKNPSKILILGSILGLASAMSKVFIVFFPSLILLIVVGIIFAVVDSLLVPAQYVVGSLVIPARLRGQGLGVLTVLFLPLIPLSVVPAYIAEKFGARTGLLMLSPLYVIGALVSISAARFFNVDQRAVIAAAAASNAYRRAKAEGTIKLLVCRDVDVAYDQIQVLFNVDFDVDAGEMIALLGTNGAGKSTLLKAISGIAPASNGVVYLDGRDITRLPPYEIARLGVVHMPGGRAVFPQLTVRENLDLAILHIDHTPELEERRKRVFEFFPVLEERIDAAAGLLSGGEQQMVGLAQAFLWAPRLLMIDELSLGLAPAVVGQLLEVVREINAQGATVILVEQSVNLALTVTNRAVFMEKGEVKFDGPTADLLNRPDIMRAVYLKGSAGLAAARRPEVGTIKSSRPILELDGITKSFGGKHVLTDVSFDLAEGAALGLIGPNGAGKTTLFDVISGYLPPDRGTILYDGVDITKVATHDRGKLGLVRRFQDAKLFGSLTVFESICVALDGKLDVRSPFITALQLPSVRRSEARIRARADRLIELLGLESFRDKFVSDLSTGSRRIVDLACVLAVEPRVLLLDEPSSGIAQAEAENLAPLLRTIRNETGCSLLIIEHDMQLISKVSDELLALVLGKTVTRGTPDEVLEHPEVVEAYLGMTDEARNRSGVLK